MLVRMTARRSWRGAQLDAGLTYTLPDAGAQMLIDEGVAVKVEPEGAMETATQEARETAVPKRTRTTRRRKGVTRGTAR